MPVPKEPIYQLKSEPHHKKDEIKFSRLANFATPGQILRECRTCESPGVWYPKCLKFSFSTSYFLIDVPLFLIFVESFLWWQFVSNSDEVIQICFQSLFSCKLGSKNYFFLSLSLFNFTEMRDSLTTTSSSGSLYLDQVRWSRQEILQS